MLDDLSTMTNRPPFDERWSKRVKETYRVVDQVQLFGRGDPAGSYVFRNRLKWVVDSVRRLVPPPASIIDVAAGQGNFTLVLAALGYDMTWNDLDDKLIEYVEAKRKSGAVRYVSGNAFDLQFETLYDAVYIGEVIEHVAHPDRFLRQVASFLRPGGFVFMTTPNGQYARFNLPKFSECPDPSLFEAQQFKPNADGHIFLLHEDELQTLAAQADLRVERIDLYNNILTSGHMKTGKLLQFVPASVVRSVEGFTRALPHPIRRKVHNAFGIVMQKA